MFISNKIAVSLRLPAFHQNCNYCCKLGINYVFHSQNSHSSERYTSSQVNLGFGPEKNERKNIQKRLRMVHDVARKEKHRYKEESTLFRDKWELAKFLKDTEVYKEKGIIAVNKPYGIKRFSTNTQTKIHSKTLNSSALGNELSIEDTLPLLKEMYDTKLLNVLHFPERWMSGVTVLSSDPKSTECLEKSKLRSVINPNKTYTVVTQGKPVPSNFSGKVGYSLKFVSNNKKVPSIEKTYSKNQIKKNLVNVVGVNHKLLHHNEETDSSLVEISLSGNQWHFIRFWMAHCYSPILGDLVYGNLVKIIAGKRVAVSPMNFDAYEPPVISNTILDCLQLSRSVCEIIPCHIHHSKYSIVGRKSVDVISAPESSLFTWTRKQLDLEYPSTIENS